MDPVDNLDKRGCFYRRWQFGSLMYVDGSLSGRDDSRLMQFCANYNDVASKGGHVTWVCKGGQFALSNYPSYWLRCLLVVIETSV